MALRARCFLIIKLPITRTNCNREEIVKIDKRKTLRASSGCVQRCFLHTGLFRSKSQSKRCLAKNVESILSAQKSVPKCSKHCPKRPEAFSSLREASPKKCLDPCSWGPKRPDRATFLWPAPRTRRHGRRCAGAPGPDRSPGARPSRGPSPTCARAVRRRPCWGAPTAASKLHDYSG